MKRPRHPGIYQRGSGWAYVLDLPRGADGRRKQEWKSGFATEVAAYQARCVRLAQTRAIGYQAPASVTVAEFLAHWLEHVTATRTQSTAANYTDAARLHLIPALGQISLGALTPLHVETYYARASRRDGKGPLSGHTLSLHHSILRQALARAVRWGLLPASPMDRTDRPRYRIPEFPVLDGPQTRRLLEAARGSYLYPAILLVAGAGLRCGEVLALCWSDVAGGAVTVRRSLRRRYGEWRMGPTKGRRERSVLLPATIGAALEALRGKPDQPVAADPAGNPIHPSALSRDFRLLLESAGLPRIRFHDTRHGHASHLFDALVPLPAISRRLGHASVAVTASIYAHRLPGQDERAAEGIERILGPGLDDVSREGAA